MTIKEIEESMVSIKIALDEYDYELAHRLENALMIDFIEYIQNNYTGKIAKMAKLIIIFMSRKGERK